MACCVAGCNCLNAYQNANPCWTPGFCCGPACSNPSNYTSPAIGTPSQVSGSNPSTTTSPGTGSDSGVWGQLLGVGVKAFGAVASQATLSAQQTIAKKTNTSSISGVAGSTALLLFGAVLVVVLVLLGKK
jgi:hypothetical protein